MGIYDFGYTCGGLIGTAISFGCVYFGLMAPLFLWGTLFGLAVCIVLDVMSYRG